MVGVAGAVKRIERKSTPPFSAKVESGAAGERAAALVRFINLRCARERTNDVAAAR